MPHASFSLRTAAPPRDGKGDVLKEVVGGGSGDEVPGLPRNRHEEPGQPKKLDRHNNLLNHFSFKKLKEYIGFFGKTDCVGY